MRPHVWGQRCAIQRDPARSTARSSAISCDLVRSTKKFLQKSGQRCQRAPSRQPSVFLNQSSLCSKDKSEI
eukprot:2861305-Prymnesium_polylepis.1